MAINTLELEKLGVCELTKSSRRTESDLFHPREVWQVYGGNYDTTFSTVLEGKTIADLVSENPKGRRRILDLMGPGQVIRDINFDLYANTQAVPVVFLKVLELFRPNQVISVDGGIAVTLVNPSKDQRQKEADQRLNLHIIEADFYHPQTKELVKQKMRYAGFDCLDFILCRPVGPFTRIPDMKEKRLIYQKLFSQFLVDYSSLLAERGILLTQIPYGLIRTRIARGQGPRTNFRQEYHDMLYQFCLENGFTYQVAEQGLIPGVAGIGLVLKLVRNQGVGSEGFGPPTSSM